MNRFLVCIFYFAITSFFSSHCSEKAIVEKRFALKPHHCQHAQYSPKDIVTTITNGVLDAEKAYAVADYRQAALFSSGTLGYLKTMHSEIATDYNNNPIDENSINSLCHIMADCHLNHLNSPQQALAVLRHIHDKSTPRGTLTSKHIAQRLHEKAKSVALSNNALATKLEAEAHFYNSNHIKTLYQCYFDALDQHNITKPKALLQKYAQLSDIQSQLRVLTLQLITPGENATKSAVNPFFTLEDKPFFNDMMSAFITFDSHHIIPALEKAVTSNKDPKKNNIFHYILGLLYYHQGLYDKSLDHLNKTNEARSDLATQCKIFISSAQCNPTISSQTAGEAIKKIQNIFAQKKENNRTKNAIAESIKILSTYAYPYAQYFLETKQNDQRKHAFYLADLCLRYDETYSIGIDIFSSIYNSNKQFCANTLQSNTCITIAQHFKKYDDNNSLKCLSTVFADYTLHHTGTINVPHFDIQYLECALDNNRYSKEGAVALKKRCSACYYQLAQETKDCAKKLTYLKQSAYYGRDSALIDLALIIFDAKNQALTEHISDREKAWILHKIELLAHDDTCNPLLRAKALGILAWMKYAVSMNENLQYISHPYSPQTIMDYSDMAYNLNGKELDPGLVLRLACDYMKGIKNELTDTWAIEPDCDKARQILEELIQRNIPEDKRLPAQLLLARAYFSCGKEYLDKSFNLFLSMIKTNKLNNEGKNIAYLHMCAIKLNNLKPNNICQAADYFYQNDASSTTKDSLVLGQLIDDTLYNKLKERASCFIKEKNTQNHVMDLCALLGEIFYSRQLKDENYTRDADFIAECLQHAANNNNIRAQLSVILYDSPQINLALKIKYLENVQKAIKDPSLSKDFALLSKPYLILIQNVLETRKCDYYNKDLKEKYECIRYLHTQANEKELENYLGSDYFNYIPSKNCSTFTTTDNALAQLYYDDTILKKYIDQFDQFCNQRGGFIPRHTLHVIYNYIYTLMNSDNHRLIKISSQYAEKLSKIAKQNSTITHILSICYYKLSIHPSLTEKLAHSYRIKSAELGNEVAIAALKDVGSIAEATRDALGKDFNKLFNTPQEKQYAAHVSHILLKTLSQTVESEQKK